MLTLGLGRPYRLSGVLLGPGVYASMNESTKLPRIDLLSTAVPSSQEHILCNIFRISQERGGPIMGHRHRLARSGI